MYFFLFLYQLFLFLVKFHGMMFCFIANPFQFCFHVRCLNVKLFTFLATKYGGSYPKTVPSPHRKLYSWTANRISIMSTDFVDTALLISIYVCNPGNDRRST